MCWSFMRPAGDTLAAIRRGEGPYLLECMTYRMAGHFVGDAQQYRSKEEIAAMREKDPIERLKRNMLAQGVAQSEIDATVERGSRTCSKPSNAPAPRIVRPRLRSASTFTSRPRSTVSRVKRFMSQTFIEILRRALDEELARDKAAHLLGEDVAAGGAFGVTRGLAQKHGETRVRNTPISEAAITGMATGAALCRAAAGARDHVHRLRHAVARLPGQSEREISVHVGRSVVRADGGTDSGGCGGWRGSSAFAEPGGSNT